jgi:predicted phosphodiesterase
LAALCCILSCRIFEYSAYQVPTEDTGQDQLAGSLDRLAATDGTERAFSFAVYADIQSAYDELNDGVNRINTDPTIRFSLVAGDLTQHGTLREYEWVNDGLEGLKTPFFAVIGNHDAIANGKKIFERKYGPFDYSFTYRGIKFVVFNDNVWEFDSNVPDMVWLDSALNAPDSVRVIAVAHIPPNGDQISPSLDSAMTEMFVRHNVLFGIFGHQHNWHIESSDSTRFRFLVVDNVADRNYAKVTIEDTVVHIERVFY